MEQVGEGGFGVVFMAEQTQPVRRRVALKVLKPGMDTRQVVARFEAERQALALMDHPNIAHVFDGGETASGRPYFVMELVKGVPITDFCDQSRLPVRERLGLFVDVCQAVQHAHQKGIIHRDLKPSNVLVTLHDDKAVVKVIDFGVAKATGQQLTDKTLFTGIAQMIGTPLYMSPEQAQMSGLDVDTRSDIYSLGVLLYELLTGTTPFDKERLRTVGYDEIRRMIREEEPPRPSTRISTLGQAATTASAQRRSDPRRLSQLFRGELDWIVMKALEKDRNRRYETASGLARDIERYLHDEPVLACPPSPGYRFRKFVRRNRARLLMVSVVALAVLVVAGTWLWLAADRAARQTANEHLVDDALQNGAALLAQGNWPEAKAIAQRAEWRLNESGGREEQHHRVRQLFADLAMVNRLDESRMLSIQLKGDSYDLAGADIAYAAAFQAYGIDALALEPSKAAERIRASAIHSRLIAALDEWIWIKLRTRNSRHGHLRAVARAADPDDWRNDVRDAAAKRDRKTLVVLADRPQAASQSPSAMVFLGRALLDVRSVAKSTEVFLGAYKKHPEDLLINLSLVHLYVWHCQPAQPQKAVGHARACLVARPDHAAIWVALGDALVGHGTTPETLDEALAAYRKAIDLKPDYANAHNALGAGLGRKGEWEKAIAAYRESLRLNPRAANVRHNLVWAYIASLAPEHAIRELKETLRLAPANAVAQRQLAFILATTGDRQLRDPAQALVLATTAVKLAPKDGECVLVLGVARYRTNDWEGAIRALTEADRFWPSGNPYVWFFLAMACGKKGEREQARTWYDRAVRCTEERRQWLDSVRCVKEDLSRFRAEAADVLGIEIPTGPGAAKAPPKKP
ncbi:MAG TPA: protein kinase [Gemmataceae bacterium]|nr:protein kinase [Gemmataceae bacterium]